MEVNLRAVALSAVAVSFATSGLAGPREDEAAIRTLRNRYNEAIARKDLAAVKAFFGDDYHVLPGASGTPLAIDGLEKTLAEQFADPAFITYERTPERIVRATYGARAVETGTWVGSWRAEDGIKRVSGIYQAMWVTSEDRWRLRNESFVTLACAGSEACAEHLAK